MKIVNVQSWTEAIIDENCSIESFYKIARILQTVINIEFTNKLSDLVSIYWDFTYKEKELTLHYNIYVGVVIFPKGLTDSTKLDNEVVRELALYLQ